MVSKSKTKKGFTAPPGGYENLVKEALLHLDERTGSSPYAIVKYLDTEYRAGEDKLKIQVKHALKRMIEKGVIVRIKNSYKLTPKGKAVPAKPKAATAAATAKKMTPKKVIKKVEKKTIPAKKVTKTTTKKATTSRTRKAAAASSKPKKSITKTRRAPAKGRTTKSRTSSRRK